MTGNKKPGFRQSFFPMNGRAFMREDGSLRLSPDHHV
jgi:hypothetical protein